MQTVSTFVAHKELLYILASETLMRLSEITRCEIHLTHDKDEILR